MLQWNARCVASPWSVDTIHGPLRFSPLAVPVHSTPAALADALGVRRILVPPFPGVLSAYGMLVAGIATEASHSILSTAQALAGDLRPVHAALDMLVDRVRTVLAGEGIHDPALAATVDLRYRGQSYELGVPFSLEDDAQPTASALADAVQAFHALHARRYGYAMPGETVEVVTLRLRAAAPGADAALPTIPLGGEDAGAALAGERPVWFSDAGSMLTPLYERSRLAAGNRLCGPALILQYDTTTVLAPGWDARVDAWGNLVAAKQVE